MGVRQLLTTAGSTLFGLFDRYPALHLGLAAYAGFCLGFSFSIAALVLVCVLLLSRRAPLILGVVVIPFLTIHFAFIFPDLPKEGVEGSGRLHIERVSKGTPKFGSTWIVTGKLRTFTNGDDVIAKNLPVRIYWPAKLKMVAANRDYQVSGKLLGDGRYRLKVNRTSEIEPVARSWSAAQFRYETKERVTKYLKGHLGSGKKSAFIAGLVTGEFSDATLLFSFGRLGLQHLMAISGFHFSILAMALIFLFRPFTSYRWQATIVTALLTAYFLFIGMGPSVQRAWVMAICALISVAFSRKSVAINGLGIALIIVLGFDPTAVNSIGFQFSFLCTAAILILYQPIEQLLARFLAVYSPEEVKQMGLPTQHAVVILVLLRRLFALSIAVNLVAIPMTLHHFHRFPVMSLIYNLFFPFLVTAIMLLLIFGIATPYLGKIFFAAASGLTGIALDFAYELPLYFDFKWRVTSLSGEAVALFSLGVMLVALGGNRYIEKYYERTRPAILRA